MPGLAHEFDLVDGGLSAAEAHRAAAADLRIRQQTPMVISRTYFDTFDWRLHDAGLRLWTEPAADGTGDVACIAVVGTRTPRARYRLGHRPLTPEVLGPELAGRIAPRILLPLVEVAHDQTVSELVNDDDKLVARLLTEEARVGGEVVARRAAVDPVRGYPGRARAVARRLAEIGLVRADSDVLTAALATSGRQPGDYSSRIVVQLDPADTVHYALGQLLAAFLAGMLRNEAGARDGADPEFVHDFRVSMRRARSLIQRVRGVWPEEATELLNDELRWLGQVSGEVRDLDVYLLGVPAFRETLPESMRGDLAPLTEFLELQRRQAGQAFIAALDSERYRRLVRRWGLLADAGAPEDSPSVREVADREIARAHRRLLKYGRKITRESPAQALHDLRVTAKKLRYLLESFRSLYPPELAAEAVGELKRLQDVLGAHQDYAVQAASLADFGKRMLSEGYGGSDTLLAMGVLVGHLDERQLLARRDFAKRFRRFASKPRRELMRQLLEAPAAGEATS